MHIPWIGYIPTQYDSLLWSLRCPEHPWTHQQEYWGGVEGWREQWHGSDEVGMDAGCIEMFWENVLEVTEEVEKQEEEAASWRSSVWQDSHPQVSGREGKNVSQAGTRSQEVAECWKGKQLSTLSAESTCFPLWLQAKVVHGKADFTCYHEPPPTNPDGYAIALHVSHFLSPLDIAGNGLV